MQAWPVRVKFIAAWATFLAIKLIFAASMPLFGDEAFYAWEALHPAWAYSDLPGGTAAVIGVGTWLAGDTVFGVRLGSLLAGALLPWLVVRLAARLGDHDNAWRAGLWSLPLPLLLPMGVMALPDGLLVLAAVLALDACAGLLARQRGAGDGVLYGQFAAALVMGALVHYRFGPLLMVGALAFFACGGLARWRDAGLWAALALGALAWWPIIDYNLGADAAGLRFQLLDRHPWAFEPRGLTQPLLQAIITTPLLYGLFAWALWRGLRSDAGPVPRFLALSGIGLWLFYLGFAPFVDRARFSLHWPLPAYLVAAALLPAALKAAHAAGRGLWARRIASWAAGFAVTASGLMALVFAIPSVPGLAARSAGTALYPDNFVGWAEVSDALRSRMAPGDVLVADHFMLAAQLSFSLDRQRQVFVLDHWNNHKHGRAAQIAAWGYDEAGLARLPVGTPAWLAFEVGETPKAQRAAWVARTCQWFEGVEWVATVEGPGGGKRFWLYRGRRAAEPGDAKCQPVLPES